MWIIAVKAQILSQPLINGKNREWWNVGLAKKSENASDKKLGFCEMRQKKPNLEFSTGVDAQMFTFLEPNHAL